MEELTIVTPCFRQNNLQRVFESINFNIVKRWIIVYDPTKPSILKPQFNHAQISEFHMEYSEPWSRCGNSQRDYAIEKIESGWIYFLDDDNIIHKNFWDLFAKVTLPYYYTFDMQEVNSEKIKLHGGRIVRCLIDTAMFLVHKEHIKDVKWSAIGDKTCGDFLFISNIQKANNISKLQIYIPEKACYHNYITNYVPPVVEVVETPIVEVVEVPQLAVTEEVTSQPEPEIVESNILLPDALQQ